MQPSKASEGCQRGAWKQDGGLGTGMATRRSVHERGGQRKLISCAKQEGYAIKHNVSEEDRAVGGDQDDKPDDPMQGLEELDVAGPRLQ